MRKVGMAGDRRGGVVELARVMEKGEGRNLGRDERG